MDYCILTRPGSCLVSVKIMMQRDACGNESECFDNKLSGSSWP